MQASSLQSLSQDRSKRPTKYIKGAMKIGLDDAVSWAKLPSAVLGLGMGQDFKAGLEDGGHMHGDATL